MTYDWDIRASIAITDRALARDPSHVRALGERAICLPILDWAEVEMERAPAETSKSAIGP